MEKTWLQRVNGDPLAWLLEEDAHNPGVRWFALTELLDRPGNDPEVVATREALMIAGPVPKILAAQTPQGYWVEPGPGYLPKYRSTVWQLIFLAQLGADGQDPRVRSACEYILDHSRSAYGGFSIDARNTGLVHCLQGNLVAALNDRLPCAWGAVKAMLALSKVPESRRTAFVQSAIDVGVDFLLGRDPAQ
ncbi:MAG TPA: hypothetical protein VE136_13690, partial [Anaerolineales bacterium]|nr:hypothetical protein [Anaerolineales bacterium]